MPSDNDNLILTVCSNDFLYIKNEFEKMGDNIFCIVSYNLEDEGFAPDRNQFRLGSEGGSKKRNCINAEQYNKLLDLVILSLFVLNKPRRNKDYQEMKIVKKYKNEYGTNDNYLDLFSNTFIFNNYKTAKTYQTQTQPIEPKLREIIDVYLKYHPLKNRLKETNNITTPFLVKFDGEPLITNNALTRKLNKIFGKNIGSSMMRKLFLTDKFGDKMEQVNEIMNEMQTDASAMGNSVGTIKTNYIKE